MKGSPSGCDTEEGIDIIEILNTRFHYGREGFILLRAATKENGVFRSFCLRACMLIEEPGLIRGFFSYRSIF